MEYRFIADAMLGKLAKWLRIMGCDVEYFSEIPDKELAEMGLRREADNPYEGYASDKEEEGEGKLFFC